MNARFISSPWLPRTFASGPAAPNSEVGNPSPARGWVCPALNAMEGVWQFMRDNRLSNRVLQDHGAIVAHCCHARNRLIDQP